MIWLTATGCVTRESVATSKDRRTDADLAVLKGERTKAEFVGRLLGVIEQERVSRGNKVFGGAILRKFDLSTVVAVSNSETGHLQGIIDHHGNTHEGTNE